MADEQERRRQRLSGALFATGLADRAAFRRVYQLTSAKLFGICLRICGERQAAEDVLQEVYLLIWRRAPAYEPARGSAIAWLATIARHRALDWRRANQRPLHDAGAGERADAPEVADAHALADVTMVEAEEAARLRACLDTLDERPRAAIRAAFMDGLTYTQLASRADVPLPTMKSMVRRALLKLRDCLDDDA